MAFRVAKCQWSSTVQGDVLHFFSLLTHLSLTLCEFISHKFVYLIGLTLTVLVSPCFEKIIPYGIADVQVLGCIRCITVIWLTTTHFRGCFTI